MTQSCSELDGRFKVGVSILRHLAFSMDGESTIKLRYDIRKWLTDENIEYKIVKMTGYEHYRWFVLFDNAQDAILFKLTWT